MIKTISCRLYALLGAMAFSFTALLMPLGATAQDAPPLEAVQTQFSDYLFSAPANYGIMGQTRLVTDVLYTIQAEGTDSPKALPVTGNCVDTYYSYLKNDDNNLDRIQLVNHYVKAISSYKPEKLFQDEYNYHARFTKDGSEYYIMVLVYSKGKEYQVVITEKLL